MPCRGADKVWPEAEPEEGGEGQGEGQGRRSSVPAGNRGQALQRQERTAPTGPNGELGKSRKLLRPGAQTKPGAATPGQICGAKILAVCKKHEEAKARRGGSRGKR